MVEVVYLTPGEQMPNIGDDQPWLFVEANPTGLFYGSGGALNPMGEWVGYGSLAQDDVSLENALTASLAWAEKYGVPTIWVQSEP
jgi:hypothetical protein